LQQQRTQQTLGWNRRAALPRIKLGKWLRQLLKRRIHKLMDRSQWMVRRNAILQPHIGEKMLQALILAAHRIPQTKGINQTHGITLQPPREPTFSAAC
jgi:hypothetical protein